jgi:choline dehydrogenase-like flavoprotein
MGTDPARSVIDENHQCHDVPGLYLVDASSFPASPGVNPQLTIMAMALRAGARLAEGLA